MNEEAKLGREPGRETRGQQLRGAVDALQEVLLDLRGLRVNITGREDETKDPKRPDSTLCPLATLLSDIPNEITSVAKSIHAEIEELRGVLF